MVRRLGMVAGAVLLAVYGRPVAAGEAAKTVDPAGVQRLEAESGGTQVRIHPATGTARFVRIAPGADAATAGLAGRGATGQATAGKAPAAATLADKARSFLASHASVFGLRDASTELAPLATRGDSRGGTHISYGQTYKGVPVFGAGLRTHFDPSGALRVVNGVTVPGIDVRTVPTRTAAAAGRAALARVTAQGKGTGLTVTSATLVVYRTGLVKGVPGESHLAWHVEVGNGRDVREFVFVDAHLGKVIDQFTGTPDALDRKAYNTTVNYPATPFWVEGQAFPTADAEANNVIAGSGEAYNFYSSAFGRDSFDGLGSTMHGVFRRTQSCPNASWNGVFTSFCPGVTPDDVVAHEWTHAYTQYTHNLIYAWQPGALNEAYSDIFGESVDFINGRGTDSPGGERNDNACSSFSALPHAVTVNSPPTIAGDYVAQPAQFGPPLTSAGLTGDVVLALDDANAGGPSTTDACTPLTNAAEVAGKIAIADRGTCSFVVKVTNAQNAGATGVIIANNAASGLPGMGGVAPAVVIPSLGVTQAAGNAIKAELAGGVNATLHSNAPSVDASYRWLVAEDSASFGGAIRDMWSPTCLGAPGKVSDIEYQCAEADNGGVHTNSGVPNHAFALIVDGGSYNGQTVAGLGLVKAIHIYYRAMTVYQGPASDFADHADALEASCSDLVGDSLADPVTGTPSGQSITAADCLEVAKATAAVELRTPPTQCAFQPILAKTPPPRCEPGTVQANVFADDFERNPLRAWTVDHTAVNPEFTPRDWEWTSTLPDRSGSALFGIDFPGGTCAPGGDESGVLHVTSPAITLPPGAANPRLTFDHWVATEPGWDGGNLKLSVNGGAWQLVAPESYTYNPYNAALFTALDGNTNPMAGEPAFTGADGGSVEGSWGRSHVDLATYAGPGDTVKLRFDLGNDGCSGVTGWYVDNPTVYACVPARHPRITIGDVAVKEGDSGLTAARLKVTLSHASKKPVTVHFITWPGSALPWFDFVVDAGKITIDPLQLEKELIVKVKGDRIPEHDETFYVFLVGADGATVGDGVGRVTILNDDKRGRHHH